MEYFIKVSAIEEVKVLNLMNNVAACIKAAEVNFNYEPEDRRHEVVEAATESLAQALEQLGLLHGMELTTRMHIEADVENEQD